MTISEATIGLPVNIGGILEEVDSSTTADNVFVFESGGKKWRMVFDGGITIYRTSWLNIGDPPTDLSSRIATALANSNIKTLEIDTTVNIGTATVDFDGKAINFLNGGRIQSTSGSISNAIISADYNQVIIDDNTTLSNCKSSTGKFSVRWFGVLSDGNDTTNMLNKASSIVGSSTQMEIIFPGSSGNYLISGTASINNNIVVSFENGAFLDVTGTFNGGIIKAGLLQQIFTKTSTVNPYGTIDTGLMSVKWFGAKGDNSTDDWEAIQNCVDTVIRNNISFKTVWLPNGSYKISKPIIAYKWTGTTYTQHTTYLKGENSFWLSPAGVGAKILPTFKDKFAIGIQRGKGCKIKGLYIQGLFTPPFTQANYDFYSCDFNDFVDPTCRDSTYSPYSGIALDPFSNTSASIPADGGYPGYTDWYRGTGGASGSTGTEIEDVFIGNFVVGVCSTPNGFTLNQELCHITKIQFASVKLAISGGQAQEKNNTVDKFACWAATHTIFATGLYGAQTPGNWYVTNGNIAGAVNRLVYNIEGTYFPSYFSDIFAESLGTFGDLASNISPTINRCVIGFAHLSVTKQTQYNIKSSGAIFRDCTLRFYGPTYPICVKGNVQFHECTFNEVPFCEGLFGGQAGSPTFSNCKITSTAGYLGHFGDLTAASNNPNLMGSSPYSNFKVLYMPDAANNSKGYIFNNSQHSFSIALGSFFISISGVDREFSITLSSSELYKIDLGKIIYTGILSERVPVGVVTNIDTNTGVVIISFTNSEIINGTYSLTVNHPIRIGSAFLGDTTGGTPNITNVKIVQGSVANLTGLWIKSPVGVTGQIGWVRIISYNSGTSTIILSSNQSYTRAGIFFYNGGIQYFEAKTINYSLPTISVLQKGGTVKLLNYAGVNGLLQEYTISQSGYLDPIAASDTRRAYFMPKTIFQCNGNPEGIIAFPSGSFAMDMTTGDVYLKTTTDENAINGGNTGWVKQKSPIKGSYSADGDSSQTTFTVTHGFGSTPSQVLVTPTSIDTAIPFFVTNKTSTTFDVVFTTPPITGTENVAFDWLVK